MKEIISAEEAAEMLGISRGYLYKFMRQGELKPIEKDTILSRRARLEFARKDVEDFRRRRLAQKNEEKHALQPTG